MELYFLGTGAGLPSTRRNVTSIALRLNEERGTFWLFDCGEGTQHQMLQSPLRPATLENVFVTHLHGDHIFGLPGLLGSRSFQAGKENIGIYGPSGLQRFVDTATLVSASHYTYGVSFHDVSEGVVFEDNQFIVQSRLLHHGIASYGYRVEEKARPGRLQVERLEALRIPPGPWYQQLKTGEDVTLADGRVLQSVDYVSAPLPGRVVVILGDTRPTDQSIDLAAGADVLVHEATYRAMDGEKAERHHHATATEAAEIARQAGVRHLVLTHISARYTEEEEQALLADAKAIFPATTLAHDHAVIPIPHHRLAHSD